MIRKRKKQQQMPAKPNPRKALFEFTEEDKEYVNMMLRKETVRKLQRLRKNPMPKEEPSLIDPEIDKALGEIEAKMGIAENPIQPIKNCRKCYFSKSFRLIGKEWYCQCTNVARSSLMLRWIWIRCESDLSCWRAP